MIGLILCGHFTLNTYTKQIWYIENLIAKKKKGRMLFFKYKYIFLWISFCCSLYCLLSIVIHKIFLLNYTLLLFFIINSYISFHKHSFMTIGESYFYYMTSLYSSDISHILQYCCILIIIMLVWLKILLN